MSYTPPAYNNLLLFLPGEYVPRGYNNLILSDDVYAFGADTGIGVETLVQLEATILESDTGTGSKEASRLQDVHIILPANLGEGETGMASLDITYGAESWAPLLMILVMDKGHVREGQMAKLEERHIGSAIAAMGRLKPIPKGALDGLPDVQLVGIGAKRQT